MDVDLSSIINKLEASKKVSKNGGEYWMGRDIQGVLGYATWEKFMNVIDRSMIACNSSGYHAEDHFHQAGKMVAIGSGAQRQRVDYFLDRYACYLIAMNGDTPETGIAQTYFAVQTRRQEMQDKLTADEKRIQLRDRVKDVNKKLGDAAKGAGVQNYPFFQAAGYKGLYDMGIPDIRAKKNIAPKDNLLDRMGRTELAMNEFRITQTEDKLIKEKIHGEQNAIDTHREVGRQIRDTIKKIGGTMPEDLPAEPPIKELIVKRNKMLKTNSKAVKG
ncbi:MAG: DNA damage-inducible protein D [Syntrophus sp. (in: bacteria)]|nr:DNA damage-inducible protein D [Syntrophus sp. (in: bacteria)]